MKSNEIDLMAKMENDYWWHIGKKHLVSELVTNYFDEPINILEIGCGTGGTTKQLVNYGNVTGFDISEDAVKYCRQNGLEDVHVIDVSKFDHTPHFDKYDLILALDVLEHIQDDMLVMSKVKDMLRDEGLFFINVPAHKFLWSEHDEALEHKRRYHRLELLSKLKDSGFTILSSSYFVSFISPAIVLYRLWGNIFGKSAYPKTSYVLLPEKINKFLVALLKLETKILLKTGLPFGVTLNVVAKKT